MLKLKPKILSLMEDKIEKSKLNKKLGGEYFAYTKKRSLELQNTICNQRVS